jgi:hypothetical protein
MRILNLTQHVGTPEQGVLEPANKQEIQNLLTFNTCPSGDDLCRVAQQLTSIAYEWRESLGKDGQLTRVMIGGAPYLMSTLEEHLRNMGFIVVYSFSQRVSEEVRGEDGAVTKTNVFKHVGWVHV